MALSIDGTNGIILPVGSLTKPSLGTAGAGMHVPVANTLSFVTNSQSRLTIDSSGTITVANNFVVSGNTTLSGTTIPVGKTLVTLDDNQTLTNKTISGSTNTLSNIGNSSLSNSSITFGSTAVSLGGTVSALNGVSLGQSTAAAGSFTTLSASSTVTLSGGTANGVAYLNASKQVTTGTSLTFNGTNLGVAGRVTAGRGVVIPNIYPIYCSDVAGTGTAAYFGSAGRTDFGLAGDYAAIGGKDGILFGASNSTTIWATINASGNLGLGVTPSGWYSPYKTMQLGMGATLSGRSDAGVWTELNANLVRAGDAVWRYLNNDVASQYIQIYGSHSWAIASTGTQGAQVSWTGNMSFDSSGLVLKQANNTANTSVRLNTAVQNALTLDSSGNLLVGTQSATGKVSVDFAGGAGTIGISANQLNAGGYCYQSYAVSNSGTYYHFIFNDGGISHGSITSNGTNTAYNTSSDYRLKENIQPIQNALSRVALLKPSKYIWKSDQSEGEGFIAHELQEVVPQAVTGEKDGEQMQGVDYGKLTPLLAAAIQEIAARLETLEQRIN